MKFFPTICHGKQNNQTATTYYHYLYHKQKHQKASINRVRKKYIKRLVTIEEVRGFLLAITTQQPKSTTPFSTPIVSELAEQSMNAKPVATIISCNHSRLI